MKAYQIVSDTGLNGLKQVELPEPKPAAGEVLVRVRATSLNYRDHMIVEGVYGRGMRLPLIPLSDGAGEVVALGEGVTQWRKGDRVAGCFFQGWERGAYVPAAAKTALGGALDGMLAEYVVLSENGIVPIPSHLSFEEGATLPCAALTAWQALVTLGKVAAGETVLLLGTGGVSTFGLLFAKMNGAKVIITSSSDEKLERARSLGADVCINYRSTLNWEEKVLQETEGLGVNHVLEVGGKDTFPKAIKSLATYGRISIIGGVSGFSAELSFGELLARMGTIQGVFVGSKEMFQAMNRAIELHEMRPAIDRVFALEETVAAYRHLQSGSHFGKIVIQL